MRIITVISAAISLCLIYYMVHPLPMRIRVPLLLLFIIVLWPLAYFLHIGIRRSLSKRLHKKLGIDEQEWEKAPVRYFFLRKQVKLVHSLTRKDIISVDVTVDSGVTARLQNPSVIGVFKKFLTGTLTFAQEQQAEQLRIQIHTHKGIFSYEAFVPISNIDDIILRFPECGDYGGIRLPGLKHWLDENVLNKENKGLVL